LGAQITVTNTQQVTDVLQFPHLQNEIIQFLLFIHKKILVPLHVQLLLAKAFYVPMQEITKNKRLKAF
jgi:hypothetical protein